MKTYRIGLTGASGTGKTTLAKWLSTYLNIPMNPVGSRSVSEAMGFASPYDVDKAGRRAEFQQRLLVEKVLWEDNNESFVTDRTTNDNLAYTMLHDVHSISADQLLVIRKALQRYTHIIVAPVSVFCKTGDDPARVNDATYQLLYESVLQGLFMSAQGGLKESGTAMYALQSSDIAPRQQEVKRFLGLDVLIVGR